jgi:hypothetical protein
VDGIAGHHGPAWQDGMDGGMMFSKPKPSKQELKKLDQGIAATEALVDLINGLEKAIESQGKAVEFIDGAIRRELARTQLTIGLSRAHLRQLAQTTRTYLAEQAAAGAGKPKSGKAKGKKAAGKKLEGTKAKATKAEAGAKPTAKAKGKPKGAAKK